MGDCLKELDETAYWLELIHRAELLPAAKVSGLETETSELTRIFVTILKHSKQ
jgi:four helix bundle protein